MFCHLGTPLARAPRDGELDFLEKCEFCIHNFQDHILWPAMIGCEQDRSARPNAQLERY